MHANTLPSGGFLGLTVRARDVPGARLVESCYSPGASLAVHCHAKAHFCYVLSGGYDEILLGRTLRRVPGTLIFLPAALGHAEIHHSGGRHFLVELDDAPLGAFDLVQGIGSPVEMSDPETAGLMARMHAEFASPDAGRACIPPTWRNDSGPATGVRSASTSGACGFASPVSAFSAHAPRSSRSPMRQDSATRVTCAMRSAGSSG